MFLGNCDTYLQVHKVLQTTRSTLHHGHRPGLLIWNCRGSKNFPPLSFLLYFPPILSFLPLTLLISFFPHISLSLSLYSSFLDAGHIPSTNITYSYNSFLVIPPSQLSITTDVSVMYLTLIHVGIVTSTISMNHSPSCEAQSRSASQSQGMLRKSSLCCVSHSSVTSSL
jgi:hypothetical protein